MSDDNIAREKLLTSRGIDKRYHRMALSTYMDPIAKKVLDLITDYTIDMYNAGIGISIIGAGITSYDIAMLVGRALILRDLPLYVVNFTDLVSEDTEVIYSIISKEYPPLLIMDFSADSNSINPHNYRRLEGFLKKHYLNKELPMFLHLPTNNIKGYELGDCASDNFREYLMNTNSVVEVSNVHCG